MKQVKFLQSFKNEDTYLISTGRKDSHSFLNFKLVFIAIFVSLLTVFEGAAQSVSIYSFTESSGTYAPVTGTNSTASGDDGVQTAIPIGFNFNFGGVVYTTFSITTNGMIRLGGAGISSGWVNNLGNAAALSPLIAPFWDDNNRGTGSIQYLTSGTPGSQVLSVSWNNINIGGSGATSGTSFASYRVDLYETSNNIEFTYGSVMATAGALSASIGLNDMGSFLSVSPGATSTASSGLANNSVSSATNLVNKKFTFAPPPPCAGTPTPGNTISSASSACVGVSFNLSLQNSTGGTGVSYVWQSADDAGFTTNVQTLASTTATASVSSITASKYYRCLVTCSASGESTYSTPVLVSLNTYCPCIPTYSTGKTDGDLIANISISGTSLSNNSGTSAENPAYTYFSGQPNYTATLVAGNSYVVSVSVGSFGSQNMAAWIDYNDDAVFSTSERIGFTTSSIGSNGSANFNIVVSCNPPLGTHRLRVRDVWNTAGNTIDPCNSYGYGETEDYDVTIVAAVACPAPSALTASNPTAASVDLAWNVGCVETAWNIEYGPIGFTPGTGTVVAATSTTATISGLTCETAYDFYVYADCGGAGASLPSLVASSTTTICPCEGTPDPGNTEASLASVCDGGSVSLSLQNDVSGLGITYQWQSSTDAMFTAPVTLGTAPTQTGTVNGNTWFRCNVTCATSGLTGASVAVMVTANPLEAGDNQASAIVIPAIQCQDSAFTHTANTTTGCYSNTYGVENASKDIWYTFSLTAPTTVEISMCGSNFDSYLNLLDAAGDAITTNDDNGPLCGGSRASLSELLMPGTYYIVAEGYSSNTGQIVLTVSNDQACNACSFPMLLNNTVATTSTTAIVSYTPTTFPGIGWYEYRYKESSSATWVFGGTSSATATSKLFTGLNPNTSYDVQARIMCSQFVGGAWSPMVTFSTPVLQDCALSPSLTANATGSSITLSWPAVTGAAWYEFRYKMTSSGVWISGGTASGAAVSRTYVGLASGTSYDFEARTYCTNGIPSAWGSMVSASTTALAGCELPPVLNMTAVTTTSSITISWPAVTGAGWYGFQYKPSASATWINGGTAGAAATSKIFLGLMAGTSYDFQARTYCPNGQVSAWSGMETFSTSGGPATIVINTNVDKPSLAMDKSLAVSNLVTKVYPNPATDKVNVEVYFENATTSAKIQLMDMSGRVVRVIETEASSGLNTVSFDTQDLSSGMYTVLVYNNGALVSTEKLKKN